MCARARVWYSKTAFACTCFQSEFAIWRHGPVSAPVWDSFKRCEVYSKFVYVVRWYPFFEPDHVGSHNLGCQPLRPLTRFSFDAKMDVKCTAKTLSPGSKRFPNTIDWTMMCIAVPGLLNQFLANAGWSQ